MSNQALYRTGFATLLAAAMASSAQAGEPRLMSQAPQGCKFVQQESCETRRSKGQLRCEKWHKKRAAKAGANVVVIVTAVTEGRGGVIVGGTVVKTSETTMTADYYSCPDQQQ